MSKILLVSNEKSTSAILEKLLKTEGYGVRIADNLAQAHEDLKTGDYNLMITTAGHDFDPEFSVITQAKIVKAGMPIIALMEAGDQEIAEALEEASLFASIEKPLKVDILLSTVQKAVDFSDEALTENVNLNLQLENVYQFENIIAESPAMKSVCDMISRVAGIDVTILLVGESGTGKKNVAQTIHVNSQRKDSPFVVVECGSSNAEEDLFGGSSKGLLETAAGGTVLLRNIDKLASDTQEKLQKVLKDGSLVSLDKPDSFIDVRLIASTSAEVEEIESNGSFNPELLKILKVIIIKIQPLRNRPEDILSTFRQVLRHKVGEGETLPDLDPEVIPLLEGYNWPGNMDGMERVLDHVLGQLSGNLIVRSDLPSELL